MIRRIWKRLVARFGPDRDARVIKLAIAEARSRHQAVRHYQRQLTELRHDQLRAAR